MTWLPRLPCGEGPRYLQIVAALENDITRGAVFAGQRLPTHREMASRLGLSVGTVSKAYAAAERRGLVSGEVGRGTFVLPRSPDLGVKEANAGGGRPINLALNAPPPTGEARLVADVLAGIAASGDLQELLGYLPHQGCAAHREAIAGWLSRDGTPIDPGQVFVTHGAQHAIAIAMRLLARPGSAVVAENLTYSGMLTLAQLDGYHLHSVAMDRHGLLPDAVDRAFSESDARVLYCTPTLQCTTGALMPESRRREIAVILRRHDAWLVEDDAYGFLVERPLPTLASLLPERSFYIVSFAKCLSPGMRIGAMVAPPEYRDRCVSAIRSTGWMANAVMAEAVTRMIRDGSLAEQVAAKRAEARRRSDLAGRLLGDALLRLSDVPAFHAWMQVPPGRSTAGLVSQAAQAGITVALPSALQTHDALSHGLRLCLGGPAQTEDLEHALGTLRAILDNAETMAMV